MSANRYALGHGPTALQILAALDIDPKGVRRLTIRIEPGDVITYEIERMALESEITRLCIVLDTAKRERVERVEPNNAAQA